MIRPQVGQFNQGGFQPSGQFGMGGSQVPVPSGDMNPQTRLSTVAARYSPAQAAMRQPPAMAMQARGRFSMAPSVAAMPQDRFTSDPTGGVRPGAMPQMNAVQAARMNGPQRPPISPGDAALSGYMAGR